MATSGKIETKWALGINKVIFEWRRTAVSLANNTSTLHWELYITTGTGGAFASVNERTWQVTINGLPKHGVVKFSTMVGDNQTVPITSGSITIPHNTDGTKTFSCSFDMQLDFVFSEKKATGSDTFTLDPISRVPLIKKAPGFSDEENPTITYSNPRGEDVTSLQMCISLTGETDDISYREISKTGTSYTFNLTNGERNVLRNAIGSAGYTRVYFFIQYTIDGKTDRSYQTALCTLVNHGPTLSPTVIDVNNRTLELTGDKNTLIRYYSNASFNTGAQALKGASIEYQTITNGSVTLDDYTSNTGVINGVDSNTFYFSVTDTRGFTAKDFVVFSEDNKKFIPYVKLTASLTTQPLEASGRLTFTVKGKYFNGSFGAKSNSMELEYMVLDSNRKPVFNGNGSGWVVLGAVTPTVDSEGNYTYSYTISGLDYDERYDLMVNVIDELTPTQVMTTVIQSVPVFDWGKSDFKHNTDVYLERGKTLRSNNSQGDDIQLFGTNAQDSLIIGWGNYDTEQGATSIYGNNISLQSNNGIYSDNTLRFANNKGIIGTKANGGQLSAFNPCNSNGRVAIGYGGYAEGYGGTDIYGNTINLTSKSKIYINGREYGANQILWQSGPAGNHMNGEQTIYLEEPISAQPNGIILVFSYHELSTGYANNVGWSTHFVPKQMVNINGGGGQTFLMGLNAGFSLIGAKYLYIKDTSISGHSGNVSTGTNSGISFRNNEFVLRYVIGV